MAETEHSTPMLDTSTRLAFDRTRAAYERTLMAWIRTATSLITFGFAVHKFFQLGRIVTWRADGLRYDGTTGQVTTGEFGVPFYPVKVVDGKILIAVEYKLVYLLQRAQKPKANSGS